jgi:hypothetical protein
MRAVIITSDPVGSIHVFILDSMVTTIFEIIKTKFATIKNMAFSKAVLFPVLF